MLIDLQLDDVVSAWNHIFQASFTVLCSRHVNVMAWAVQQHLIYVGETRFSIMIWAPNLNIKHVSRFVLKNAETVEGTSNLGPVKRKLESEQSKLEINLWYLLLLINLMCLAN